MKRWVMGPGGGDGWGGGGRFTSRLEKLPDPGLSLPIRVPDPEQTGELLDNPQ